MKEKPAPIEIKKSKLKKLAGDPEATAKAVRLVYVSSGIDGIERVKARSGFAYRYKNQTVKDKEQLNRIKSLVLPPAWQEVWICTMPNGHLQATGKDMMQRKQYRYHPLWNDLRNKTKFYRMLELGKVLPAIRRKVQKDLALPGLPKNKVLAVIISLMEKTGIRVGNEFYEKLHGSFGLTTLKDKHVSIKKGVVHFNFRGKKGVEQQVTLASKRLSRIVTQCRDVPGKELFQYFDEKGKRQSIESGMVNEYLKEIAEGEFTAKDLRTWCGSVTALQAIKETGSFETKKEAKKKVIEVLDKVSVQLGNTRTVCKKYYVHPSLLDLYENGKMDKWMNKIKPSSKIAADDLADEERVFMKILERETI